MAKDKNLINDACTNAAYRLMEIDYNDDPKFWIERFKIEYDGNMQRYNAKSDEEKKDKITYIIHGTAVKVAENHIVSIF